LPRVDPQDAAKHLKHILDDFAAATGLQINFTKTTFIPLNVDPQDATQMASDLATNIFSFPQIYLGLPLSRTNYRPLPSSLSLTVVIPI
uniref:Reverse transcriptase domain-containing protein n=1 Tax=Aegilops tauschii subsp. strangulata TaxID=200361 RepID=A0A452YKQ5_AEGTS